MSTVCLPNCLKQNSPFSLSSSQLFNTSVYNSLFCATNTTRIYLTQPIRVQSTDISIIIGSSFINDITANSAAIVVQPGICPEDKQQCLPLSPTQTHGAMYVYIIIITSLTSLSLSLVT